jgi:hypothetical protein
MVDLNLTSTNNVDDFSVYINDDYVGDNVTKLQINTNDLVRFEIVKDIPSNDSIIKWEATLQ